VKNDRFRKLISAKCALARKAPGMIQYIKEKPAAADEQGRKGRDEAIHATGPRGAESSRNHTAGREIVERQTVIANLNAEIETLTRLHIQHGLQQTQGFARQKEDIARLIRDHEVDLRRELEPHVLNLYRRYFG